jgi:hypothetical protein
MNAEAAYPMTVGTTSTFDLQDHSLSHARQVCKCIGMLARTSIWHCCNALNSTKTGSVSATYAQKREAVPHAAEVAKKL